MPPAKLSPTTKVVNGNRCDICGAPTFAVNDDLCFDCFLHTYHDNKQVWTCRLCIATFVKAAIRAVYLLLAHWGRV
jgi:hypothetical protein